MISIIIPFYNEEENIGVLLRELTEALKSHEYEIICIDDGSIDGSSNVVQKKKHDDPRIVLISYHKRRGKGYALKKGIKVARGDTIIFMDADCQDDPADIPAFIAKLNAGYDVVNGWRKNRQDKKSMKTISQIGNTVVWRGLLHSTLHDVNCGFKAFKRKVVETIPLYGDNFRFLPLLAEQEGYRVSEVEVHNRPRGSGVSKYTSLKMVYGLFDTLTTYFIFRFAEKPLHFFGVIGGGLFVSGFVVALILSIQRIFFGILLYRRPALLLAVLLIIVGIQIMMTGIVAELFVYLNKKSEKLD